MWAFREEETEHRDILTVATPAYYGSGRYHSRVGKYNVIFSHDRFSLTKTTSAAISPS